MLDGVRGVAALLVMLHHAALVFPNAFLAVDLFFMLSGFVLAHGYGERLASRGDRRRFAVARLIRLYPLYLAGCLIALPAAIGMAIVGWSYFNLPVLALSIVTAPFFILLPYDGFTIPLNPPGWSLTFELIANGLFLLTGTRTARVLPVVVLSAILLLWGMHLFRGGETGWHSFWGAFPRTFFSFFAGVLLSQAWHHRWWPRIGVPAALVLALAVLVCVLAPRHFRVFQAAAVFLIHPAIIWLGASARANPMMERACAYLGLLSFGIYVLHVPIIMCVEGVRFLVIGADAAGYATSSATAWISVPLTLVVAHFLTFRLDVPARRFLASRLSVRGEAR